MFGQAFDQISGQIFEQIFGQGFDQGLGEGENPQIQCTVLPDLKEKT